MAKFPKVLYVHKETDSNCAFFVPDRELDAHVAMGEEIVVAEYRLKRKIVVRGKAKIIKK